MRARPLPVTVAIVLLALLSLANLLSPVMPSEGGTGVRHLPRRGAGRARPHRRSRVVDAQAVGSVAYHRRLCAQHPFGGSGAGLRADTYAASPCNGRGCGLRFSYLVGGAAELAASVHLTSIGKQLNPDVGG